MDAQPDCSEDEKMIQQLVSMQQVPVVASLQWETLQSLLRSVCSRLAHQASRIEKAEDQGKVLAVMADDLDRLCKTTMMEAKMGKESEDAKLQNWSRMIEERLKGLDATVNQQSSTEIGLQGVNSSNLQSLPSRVAALEEKIGERFQQITMQGGSMENGLLVDPDSKQFEKNMEDLPINFIEHAKRLDSLEEQIKDLKVLLQEISKAHSSDFESLQNINRNLRSDFEMRPILELTNLENNPDDEKGDRKIVLPVAVAKKGGMKGVSGEVFDNLVKQLEGEISTLATQLAAKADRKDLDSIQMQMTLHEHTPGRVEELMAESSSQEQQTQVQWDESQGIQEDQEGDQHREEKTSQEEQKENLGQAQKTHILNSGNDIQRKRSSYDTIGPVLQKIQEMLSQKADRNELLQLHEMLHHRRSETPYILPGDSANIEDLQTLYMGLIQELDDMSKKMKDMEERSDLAVLLSKRLENFAQPAATIQESSQGFEEIQAAINEHAERMMSYADTLLQMETLLASKADAAGLQALKASIVELHKRSMPTGSFFPIMASHNKHTKQDKSVGDIHLEDKIERHDQLLSQLLKTVSLLGKGMLTLSGEDYHRVSPTELLKGVDKDNMYSSLEHKPGNANPDQNGVTADASASVNLQQQNLDFTAEGSGLLSGGGEAHAENEDEEGKITYEEQGENSQILFQDSEAHEPSKSGISNCKTNHILEQFEA